jgi:hypothetical protein
MKRAAAAFVSLVLVVAIEAVAQSEKPPKRLLLRPPPQPPPLRQLRFSPDGRYILAQGHSWITVLSVSPFQALFRIPARGATLAQFTPDSESVILVGSVTQVTSGAIELASSPSEVETWSIVKRARSDSTEIQSRQCRTLELSPTGLALGCVDFGGTFRLLDVPSGQTIFEKKNFAQPYVDWGRDPTLGMYTRYESGDPSSARINFSPDGRYVIAAPMFAEGSPVVWDLHAGKAVRPSGDLRRHYSADHIVFVARDRVVIGRTKLTGTWSWDAVLITTLETFPSGEVLLRPKVPPGPLFRTADPGFVLVSPFGTFERWSDNATRSCAVELSTGRFFISHTPALDILGNHYVAEILNGKVALYERDKGVRAVVKIEAR